MKTMSMIAAAGAFALVAAAQAGTISVAEIGGGITLQSGPLSSTVFGTGDPGWTTASLQSVHTALGASGINTNGKVTFLAADTDRGLAFLALIDQQTSSPSGPMDGNLAMTSVAAGSNIGYVNDVGDAVAITPPAGNSRIATGTFNWRSNGSGDGFGWANLVVGNTFTFRFSAITGASLGLDNPETFQFVTWTGNGYSLINVPAGQRSFSSSNEYGFSAVVIPLPGAALMAMAPLGVLPLIRRRK